MLVSLSMAERSARHFRAVRVVLIVSHTLLSTKGPDTRVGPGQRS